MTFSLTLLCCDGVHRLSCEVPIGEHTSFLIYAIHVGDGTVNFFKRVIHRVLVAAYVRHEHRMTGAPAILVF